MRETVCLRHTLSCCRPLNFMSVLELGGSQWHIQCGHCHRGRPWWGRGGHAPPPENASRCTLPHLRAFVLAFLCLENAPPEWPPVQYSDHSSDVTGAGRPVLTPPQPPSASSPCLFPLWHFPQSANGKFTCLFICLLSAFPTGV